MLRWEGLGQRDGSGAPSRLAPISGFPSGHHEWLLGPKVDILPFLLLPLAGPEDFSEEEMEREWLGPSLRVGPAGGVQMHRSGRTPSETFPLGDAELRWDLQRQGLAYRPVQAASNPFIRLQGCLLTCSTCRQTSSGSLMLTFERCSLRPSCW